MTAISDETHQAESPGHLIDFAGGHSVREAPVRCVLLRLLYSLFPARKKRESKFTSSARSCENG